MSTVKIIVTEDGSNSLYHEDLKETYHSFHGAVQESRHVFIEKGLRFWRTKEGLPDKVRIFEVGLGTGLNALLTAQFAMENKISISYTGIEPHPLEQSLIEQLNYPDKLGNEALKNIFTNIHSAQWENKQIIHPHFDLTKNKNTLQDYPTTKEVFDLIYFDAFAPSKQGELWDVSLLQKCFDLLKKGGVFTTYSAKGQLKRDLKTVGFELETLPGPPGKKEMVRGIKV